MSVNMSNSNANRNEDIRPSMSPHGIIGYVADEQRTFDELPFSRVDSLAFSQLSYFNWGELDGIPLGFAFDNPVKIKDVFKLGDYTRMFGIARDFDDNSALYALMCVSRRWGDVRILNHCSIFDDDVDKQFSATTFLLPTGLVYVAFRGTDMTVTGWKEDFMLAFRKQIPSQTESTLYLDNVIRGIRDKMRQSELQRGYPLTGRMVVGGHSKGGNLAIYSAATCAPHGFEMIDKIYDHDGPGFSREAMKLANIGKVVGKVDKTVPVDSIVGVVLPDPCDYLVTLSNATGLDEHNPYHWRVVDGDFEYADEVSGISRLFGKTMDTWLSGLTKEQMATFTDAFFGILSAGKTTNLEDIDPSHIRDSAMYLRKMDPKMRKMFFDVFGKFFQTSARNLLWELLSAN